MAIEYSKQFEEYSDAVEKIFVNEYSFSKEDFEKVSEKLFFGFINDVPVDELVKDIV